MNNQRNLLVVSGPSGCGKDTVVQMMMQMHPEIEISVSATTRAPRAGEKDGVNYHFLTKEDFEAHIQNGALLEYANYVGNYYGTLKQEVDSRIERDKVCVLVIEVTGAANVKKVYPECTTVFVLPPSMDELERRLRNRGTESDEWVEKRLARARQEVEMAGKYDYQLINADAKVCAEELYEILRARKQK